MTPEELAHEALRWLLRLERAGTWPWIPGEDGDPGLYSGGAGVVLAFLEAHAHFNDDRYADAALRGAAALADSIVDIDDPSLYFGLTGIAVVLSAAGTRLDADLGDAVRCAHAKILRGFDGQRWGEFTELYKGNAGIALGLLHLGDIDTAERAVEPYLQWAEPTPTGVHWESRTGYPGRAHHISHGTLGIVTALAAVARATGRRDLTDLALAGAADVTSRNEDEHGFLVPHSDPPHKPELNPRYSYGWCDGPTGDAQAFRWLHAGTGERTWLDLIDRCWHTVTHSGLPARLRPGFWDNSGRCCGTAGVLAFACDRIADRVPDAEAFAETLVADLTARSTVDDHGARWHNHDHRANTDLPPRTGWAMGNAGIVRELLRYAGPDRRYALPLPDDPTKA